MPLDVNFIGVAGVAPQAGQETACYVVNGAILIDTGWNAAVSMQATDISPTDIDHVFLTHCHHDHVLGLPGLLFANRGRQAARPEAPRLRLYGPRDLATVTDGALALLQTARYPDCAPEHEVTQIFPGDVVELDGLRVEVGRAFHPLDAYCYRLTDTVTGASVVFSGDTAYHEGLSEFARDCDVLIHEAASPAEAEVGDLQRYLHSRPQDAARVAQEAGVTSLALVHYAMGSGPALLAKAKEVFVNTRLAKRGQRLSVLGPGQAAWV